MASVAQVSNVAHRSFVICYVLARFVYKSRNVYIFAQYCEINVKTGLVPLEVKVSVKTCTLGDMWWVLS